MGGQYSRRQLLRVGALTGTGGLAGCHSTEKRNPTDTPTPGGASNSDDTPDAPVDVRGAIYMPTRAYNHYQMWRGYDPNVVERDLGYATRVNLNAVRVWLSYEWWKEDSEALAASVDHFLSAAAANGIRVLISLFDSVGSVEPWDEVLARNDPATGVPAAGPLDRVIKDPDRWTKPLKYVRWFMDRYRDDDRLLAIEVMNEPGWSDAEKAFARGMFRKMAKERGAIQLTVGATSLIHSVDYLEWGADVLQFHYNYPRSEEAFRRIAEDAVSHAERLDLPVWLTEWQRIRTSGGGFSGNIKGGEWRPKYRTMIPTIRELGVGNFFWSLMVKPAFTLDQREMGTVNGLFHEDGAVWSLEDARAIKSMSGNPDFEGRERPERPNWMSEDEIKREEGENDG